MAAGENLNRLQVIINEDLGFRPHGKRKGQDLILAQIIERLQRCKKLLNRHGSKSVDRIILVIIW